MAGGSHWRAALFASASASASALGACTDARPVLQAVAGAGGLTTSSAGTAATNGSANAAGNGGRAAAPAAGLSGSAGAGNSPQGGSAQGGSSEALAGAAGAEAEQELRTLPYPPSSYPLENPDSDPKALLGKVLFWDEQLSGDDTVACGTCHRPNAGGSDPRSASLASAAPGPDGVSGTLDDVHGSLGVVRCNAQGQRTGQTAQLTTRKAPTYLDAMAPGRLFWDGRAECAKAGCPSFSAFEDPDAPGTFPIASGGALENQVIGPPLSAVEMACEGATWAGIHQKLQGVKPLALARQVPKDMSDFIAAHGSSYPSLFAAAFGTEQTSGPAAQINTRRIAFAIATHERRLRSDQTPWDRWNAGDDEALTAAQLRGLDVFTHKARCKQCHGAPVFSDVAFHFIGFHRPAWDLGRKAIDDEFGVPGALRTPTLRNVGLREATGLLHNGAGTGASLAQIIELYDLGGLVDDVSVTQAPIDSIIQPLQLTPGEKSDLLDFLQHGLDDPRVAAQTPPFDRPLLSSE